ncbi:hypothetical protein GGD83_002843 [Rhodoblastus sphagnicola]|nr:hypothetical protein [Rhodoblastus sphagnicola]MBB4199032.1 hypothetical protein [Rhodoblastus sphagnicola]
MSEDTQDILAGFGVVAVVIVFIAAALGFYLAHLGITGPQAWGP